MKWYSNIDYVSSEIMQQQENFRKDFNAVTSKQILAGMSSNNDLDCQLHFWFGRNPNSLADVI